MKQKVGTFRKYTLETTEKVYKQRGICRVIFMSDFSIVFCSNKPSICNKEYPYVQGLKCAIQKLSDRLYELKTSHTIKGF